jgi:hypothetical protein
MSKMSELDYDRQTIEAVRRVMEEPTLSAEEQIERKVDWLVRELDELCKMAANSETVDLVEKQKIGIGQIAVRTQLILSFLLARKTPAFRIVR